MKDRNSKTLQHTQSYTDIHFRKCFRSLLNTGDRKVNSRSYNLLLEISRIDQKMSHRINTGGVRTGKWSRLPCAIFSKPIFVFYMWLSITSLIDRSMEERKKSIQNHIWAQTEPQTVRFESLCLEQHSDY